MACHICGEESVDRCFTCGQLFCPKHGKKNCMRCERGIAPGDRRADRIMSQPGSGEGSRAWWRPQQAEEFEPPACHVCQGLARVRCTQCRQFYCGDHASSPGWCAPCARESRNANWQLAAIVGILGAIFAISLFLQWFG